MVGGWTSLLIAAQNGLVDVVDLLIASGANVNKAAANGATPLYRAAEQGHRDVVEMLIAIGATVRQTDDSGFSPLMIVAQNGHAGVVDLLIAAGANVNKAEPDGATPLILAAQNGHGGIVALLLARGANVNNAAANKMTPLYVAARNGHSHVVEQLIAAGANLNDASAEGMTPVYVSALNGRRDVVEMLIESGADLNRATHDGRTPAYAAALLGHAVAFDMLLGALGCDVVNQADNDGWTLAHAAASTGHAVLTSLLRAGCDVSTVKTKDGDTPLQLALRYNNMAAIELLATAAPTRALRGRSIALFSLVVAFLGSWALYQASWALYQARGAGARADAACLDLLRDSGSDQAVRRIGALSQPRSTTTKRRREKSKPGAVRRTMHEDADAATTTTTTSGEPRGALTQSRTLPSEPPAADDNDEAAMHIDESSQAGDAASHSVEEVKTETCEDEHTRPVEASPPPDDFDDATTVALLESLGLGSLLAVFREHEIDDSALLYLEPGDMRDMDIPLASALKILSAVRSCHKSQELLSAQAVLEAELHEHRAELTRLMDAQRDVDEDFMCPISSELMKDPVFARDGHTYERCCIEQWFATGASTSPLTNEALSSLDLVPNIFARKKIAEFLDKCRRAPGFR